MKTIPVVLLDNAQGDDVQELVGGGQAAHGTDEPVALGRRHQPGDGIILLTLSLIHI